MLVRNRTQVWMKCLSFFMCSQFEWFWQKVCQFMELRAEKDLLLECVDVWKVLNKKKCDCKVYLINLICLCVYMSKLSKLMPLMQLVKQKRRSNMHVIDEVFFNCSNLYYFLLGILVYQFITCCVEVFTTVCSKVGSMKWLPCL